MTPGPRTPVLVGAAQAVDRVSDPATALSPLQMLQRVALGALGDAGVAAAAVDTVAVVRQFADSSPAFACPFGHYTNLPRSLANRLGAPSRTLLYGPVGGNTPQQLCNLFAGRIADGEADVVLLAGCEALRTQAHAVKAGVALDWSDDAGGVPETLGPETQLLSAHEIAHGIALPAHVYPLFENALAHRYGRSPAQHRAAIGRLMHPFSQTAALNPYAALPVERSPSALVTATDENRMVAWPYPKWLISNMFVDQAAAVLLMSTAAADGLGVAADRRVYLHGAADVNERILVSDRRDYQSSPAIRLGAAHALAQAGVDASTPAYVDLYSCFPSAVQIAADSIGLAHDDPRGLTLTGGLPYFGGPGNNYSLHAIAEAARRCRSDPEAYAFVFANGGYLTKHSFGVWSCRPAGAFVRADASGLQREVDAVPAPALCRTPDGTGKIETFTVVHERGAPAFAIVIGRLDDGRRFLAQSREQLAGFMDRSIIGRPVAVTPGDPVNTVRLL